MATPTPASLLQPDGPVAADLYPDDAAPPATGAGSVLGRMATYIATAQVKVAGLASGSVASVDEAVLAWALHLAFTQAYLLRAARPATESLATMGLPTITYTSEQLKALRAQADSYRVAFEALLVVPAGVDAAPAQGSTSTRNRIRWH